MAEQHLFKNFGGCFRNYRTMLGLTLRQFCALNNFDPGNISRIERGVSAPARASLAGYAEALKLRPGSDEWKDFESSGSIARGEVPERTMSDAQLVQRLPVLLRTIGDKRLSSKQLDELLKRIKDEL